MWEHHTAPRLYWDWLILLLMGYIVIVPPFLIAFGISTVSGSHYAQYKWPQGRDAASCATPNLMNRAFIM